MSPKITFKKIKKINYFKIVQERPENEKKCNQNALIYFMPLKKRSCFYKQIIVTKDQKGDLYNKYNPFTNRNFFLKRPIQ